MIFGTRRPASSPRTRWWREPEPQLKPLDGYANHDPVEFRPRPGIVRAIFLAIAIAGCATATARSQPVTPAPMPAETTSAAASPAAEPLPPEVVPVDARQAFAAGYKAFMDHDYARAITNLTSAADRYPGLGDYALFYLAEAQSAQADLTGASATFERLRAEYPQSVLTPPAELELAQIFLKLGRNADALSVATQLVATTSDASLGQDARFVQAQAERAMGLDKEAYQHAMAIRESDPRGEADSKARGLAYSIRAANPSVSAVSTFTYHRSEAALLLREGLPSLAFDEAQQALALAPTTSDRAELLWIEARASKADSDRQKRALLEYLSIAPLGPDASAVLYELALVYWKEEDPDRARATFGKVIAEFPSSSHASGAMLRIGRIYEEQQDYDAARAEYGRLVERYPRTEAAEDARFRIPWSLYMAHQYSRAAASFAAMRKRAEGTAEREMFDYWRARSLEKIGDSAGAHEIYARLAQSVETNYYPALAAKHVSGVRAELGAAALPELSVEPTPQSTSPTVRFHLSRILALRALGISDLQAGEYRALEDASSDEHSLREFILAGLQAADAWYDAIVAATRMSKNGHLTAAVAERVRYPRAYWALFSRTAEQQSLDPWLVLALARQESLFNPRARSVSDARGLMQLLPSTGDRIAHQVGEGSSPNLFDPQTNVRLGTVYLKNLFDLFQGDQFKAVAAYNGGEHAVEGWTRRFPGDDDEWVENIGYRETRDYVKKVIGGRREYLLLYPSREESPAMRSAPVSP
jgi:soluble lytic murein transglycosylase